MSVNSFLTHGPAAAAAAAFSAHHNSNSARKRRFSQQATSQQESPLSSHYGFEEEEEQMLTNGQKRKLLSDLLISEQHIKIIDKNEFAHHSANGVQQEEFAIDSELVQDLSMTKSRFEQLNSGEQTQDKLSDDEMDSQSFASNAGKSMDSDNSVASDDEEEEEMADLNGRTKVQMMNGFKLEKNHYEPEEKLTLDLPRKYNSNDECAPNLPNAEEEETDKTLNDKVDEQMPENTDGITLAQ